MDHRRRVAEFWDDVLRRWVDGEDHLIPPLPEWQASYTGTGKGAVDPSCYPDPYVGDLRGDTHNIRLVVLGLNPGRGYAALQGPQGTWTQRIRDVGYSHCFERSPSEDPTSWKTLHGKQSPYWRNLIAFGRRWTTDPGFGVTNILNFELYPWHSDAVTGPMIPPPHLIAEFVWAPCQEVETDLVFAFGAPWFDICDGLGLPEAKTWGAGHSPFPDLDDDKGWRMRAYRLPSEQFAIVSAQPGFAGPPGPKRLDSMRGAVAELYREWDMPVPSALVVPARSSSERASSDLATQRRSSRTDGEPPIVQPNADVPRENNATSSVPLWWRQTRIVLESVGILHRRGFQRLRIVPGMSGSGMSWRCSVTSASNVEPEPAVRGLDRLIDHDLAAHWTNADSERLFGIEWRDSMTAHELADLMIAAHPRMVEAGRGEDWRYAGWFVTVLGALDQGCVPVFYADSLIVTDRQTPLASIDGSPKPALGLPPAP